MSPGPSPWTKFPALSETTTVTETTSTLTILGPEDHRLEGTPAEVEKRTKRLTSIGRPLPDVEVQIQESAGHAFENANNKQAYRADDAAQARKLTAEFLEKHLKE